MKETTQDSLWHYFMLYMLVNGTATYLMEKRTEKKVMDIFNGIKVGKALINQTKRVIPKELKMYIFKLEKEIGKNNLNNLYNNLKNLKIEQDRLMLLTGLLGYYQGKENKLKYSLSSVIGHEILHLASSYYNKEDNIHQTGFVLYHKKIVYGKALNEGYTDLLARRLFNTKTSFYQGEVRVVRFLELLFNKEEVATYYFNNDLVSFINKLSHYIGKEEALKLILEFDRGFQLKKQNNPLYKIIYTNIEVKLCNLYKKHNQSFLKQIDFLKLLDEAALTKTIYKTKEKHLKK